MVQVSSVTDGFIGVIDAYGTVVFILSAAYVLDVPVQPCASFGKDMGDAFDTGSQQSDIYRVFIIVGAGNIDDRQVIVLVPVDHIAKQFQVLFGDHIRFSDDRQVMIVFQISVPDQKGDEMRGAELGIAHQCLFLITAVETDGHLMVVEIHDIVCGPDNTVFRCCLVVTDGCDVFFFVVDDMKPQVLIAEADICFIVPDQTVDDVFMIGAGLIPFDDKIDEVLLCHGRFDIQQCTEQQHA